MSSQRERRRWPRRRIEGRRIGIVSHPGLSRPQGVAHLRGTTIMYTVIYDQSDSGVALKSPFRVAPGWQLRLVMQQEPGGVWQERKARLAWIERNPEGSGYLCGLEFTDLPDHQQRDRCRLPDPGSMSPQDLEFILNTKLLKALPWDAVCPLLNCLEERLLSAGSRFITQGDPGQSLFLIQQGRCTVQVEKDGEIKTVACLREGDVVGEMAVLTGEARSAHVRADSDMRLWELRRDQFDRVAREHSDLREFLTELLTNRLENSPAMADRSIGRYTLNQRLGQGGWSFVYRGRHQALHMPVAIKMLKHNLAMDSNFLEGFRREGQVIANMNHPNIVKVYDIEERFRTVFIIMECLEGEALDSLLHRHGALPLDRVLIILDQVLAGLDYAHERGVVHQDIKPANIFLQAADRVKILDFGLACSTGEEDPLLPGTFHYMSPEQIEGLAVDRRSDLYSLGITAYEMITGRPPFAGEDMAAVLQRHLDQEVPDPALAVPGLPEGFSQFLARTTRRSPAERFQSASEARSALRVLSADLGLGLEGGPQNVRRVALVALSYREEQALKVAGLLDEFSRRAEEEGLSLTMTEPMDL